MRGLDALIRYVCVASEHEPEVRGQRGDLTVYEGSWAFCPGDRRDGHQWREIGGVDAHGLRRYGLREPQAT